MSQESLENFGAYRLAMELFDLVVEDMGQVERQAQTYRLIGQQVASADAILGILSKTIVSLRRKASTPSPLALQTSSPSFHA